jgi:hypothetical protein
MVRRDRKRSLAAAAKSAAKSKPQRGKPGSLIRRAQQWLAARERLVSGWFARTHGRARASMQARIHAHKAKRVGGAGAIVVPYWWEYESPLKRQIALEAMLRRLFSVVPTMPNAA